MLDLLQRLSLSEGCPKRSVFGQAANTCTTDGAVWCSLIAFGEQAEALKEQKASAAISVAGRATPSAWLDKTGEPKAGLSVVVDQLAALRTRPKPKPAPAPAPALDFDDDLPDM